MFNETGVGQGWTPISILDKNRGGETGLFRESGKQNLPRPIPLPSLYETEKIVNCKLKLVHSGPPIRLLPTYVINYINLV